MRLRRKTQAAPVDTTAPTLSPGRSGRGLVRRPKAWLIRRSIVRALSHPAVAPVVAVAAIGVLAALMVGVMVGTVIGAGLRGGGESWE